MKNMSLRVLTTCLKHLLASLEETILGKQSLKSEQQTECENVDLEACAMVLFIHRSRMHTGADSLFCLTIRSRLSCYIQPRRKTVDRHTDTDTDTDTQLR